MEWVLASEPEVRAFFEEHARSCSYMHQYLDGILPMNHIHFIYWKNERVGFIDLKFQTYEGFMKHDDAEWLADYIQKDKTYWFVETLEILPAYRRKGIGTTVANKLREEARHTIVLQCTDDSYDFWYNQNFSFLDESGDYWYYCEPISLQKVS